MKNRLYELEALNVIINTHNNIVKLSYISQPITCNKETHKLNSRVLHNIKNAYND